MNIKNKILFILSLATVSFNLPAYALEITNDNTSFKLSGYGTVMSLTSDYTTYIPADFRIRTQISYNIQSQNHIGAVYSMDQLAVENDHFARDAFVFFETDNIGRLEIGWTDSISTKMGFGIPDVGGLRLNDYSILYNKLPISGAIISNPSGGGTKYSLRTNLVSNPTNNWQFGLSIAPYSDHFDYALDIATKYKNPFGKTKLALSIGHGFIKNPHGLSADIFAPSVFADWRAQMSFGFNLQYNSFIWGTNLRAIYDKNPIGMISDGVSAGTGVSYDFLRFTASASYLTSFVGAFSHDNEINAVDGNFIAHTGIISARYKYNEWVNVWISGGITDYGTTAPFVSAGLRTEF